MNEISNIKINLYQISFCTLSSAVKSRGDAALAASGQMYWMETETETEWMWKLRKETKNKHSTIETYFKDQF